MNAINRLPLATAAAACLIWACAGNAIAQTASAAGSALDADKALLKQETADAAPGQRVPPNVTRSAPSKSSAITIYEYQPDRIYPVRAGLGITTEIELSPNEKILDYSTGFSSGWDLTRRDNVFYLKPKNVDVDTNMMIRTETHNYIFELRVVATDWRTLQEARGAGVQYHIRFTYPADATFANPIIGKAEPEPELSTTLLKDRAYNFNYDYATDNTGFPWLIPVNVWDDGRFTYIRMPDLKAFPTGNFPAVYMRETERSEDSLVNTTVQGNTIIVHGTYNYLIVRHDKRIVALRRNTDSIKEALGTLERPDHNRRASSNTASLY